MVFCFLVVDQEASKLWGIWKCFLVIFLSWNPTWARDNWFLCGIFSLVDCFFRRFLLFRHRNKAFSPFARVCNWLAVWVHRLQLWNDKVWAASSSVPVLLLQALQTLGHARVPGVYRLAAFVELFILRQLIGHIGKALLCLIEGTRIRSLSLNRLGRVIFVLIIVFRSVPKRCCHTLFLWLPVQNFETVVWTFWCPPVSLRLFGLAIFTVISEELKNQSGELRCLFIALLDFA